MSELVDLYFLVKTRDKGKVLDFLNKFAPCRMEVAEDYPVPIYSNEPKCVYDKVLDLMKYLEKYTSEEYSIYWKNLNLDSNIKYLMTFYTDDSGLIFGISIVGKNPMDSNIAIKYFTIKKFLSATIGCATIEEVPPFNMMEFDDFCRNRYIPHADL